MQCNTCNGMRFVLVERPKRWYQSGISAVIGTHRVNELCPDCHGSGLQVDPSRDPNCSWCKGTGEMVVSDGTGCVDFDLCQCEAPVPALEAR